MLEKRNSNSLVYMALLLYVSVMLAQSFLFYNNRNPTVAELSTYSIVQNIQGENNLSIFPKAQQLSKSNQKYLNKNYVDSESEYLPAIIFYLIAPIIQFKKIQINHYDNTFVYTFLHTTHVLRGPPICHLS